MERTRPVVMTMRGAGMLSVSLLCLGLLSGCSPYLRADQADAAERADVDTFMHEHLPSQSIVTVAEAYRAMTLLVDGDDRFEDFASRAASLEERGIMRPVWGLEREAAVDRGSIAYMVCQILRIRGEINLMVLGGAGIGDRRYALRELSYIDIMSETPPYRYISGGELLAIMARADALMAEKGLYEEETMDILDAFDAHAAEMGANGQVNEDGQTPPEEKPPGS